MLTVEQNDPRITRTNTKTDVQRTTRVGAKNLANEGEFLLAWSIEFTLQKYRQFWKTGDHAGDDDFQKPVSIIRALFPEIFG